METTNRSLMTLRAADIMSRDIVMIPREMSLEGAARLLSRSGVTGAPIVDEERRCIGVLSATDFMHSVDAHQPYTNSTRPPESTAHCAWQLPEENMNSCPSVADFMTKDPVLVGPNTTIGELARIMMDAHIHRIIVADMATRRPLGIVSSMDILAAVARVDKLPNIDDESEDNTGRPVYSWRAPSKPD